MIEWIFWLALLLASYSYFIYPLILRALLWLRPDSRKAGDHHALPSMTLVVTAFNEQVRIEEKIANSLAIDYPGIALIVASDGSTDATDDIVRRYSSHGVRLVRASERLGKENAQLCAIREVSGDVVVFSDVATRIPSEALRRLAVYFQDPGVGAVSSEDRFLTEHGDLAGEGAYVRYEMWLRRAESKLAGLVGLSGSFFAARVRVCEHWDIHSPSDFNSALNCARLGLRAVTAPDVLGYYRDLSDPRKEYERKVRTVLRGMTAIARHPDALSVSRFGLFAWQVWSHKVMRWAVPWLLILLVLVNAALLDRSGIYLVAMVGQLTFYGIAGLAHVSQRVRKLGVARLVYFFVQVNVALADAFLRLISGKRMTTWTPSSR